MGDFDVYRITEIIPVGRVATYGQVAGMIDDPRNVWQVQDALKRAPKHVPSHRVISNDGTVENEEQQKLLEDEGVLFNSDGSIDLNGHQWQA